MATIVKVKNRWRAQVRKKGINLSGTFSTKAQAQKWATLKEIEIDDGGFETKLGAGKTVDDALKEYGKRVTIHKATNEWEQRRLIWLSKTWLADLKLSEINTSHTALWRDERIKDVSGSTVNRDFNLLSHVFNKCIKEWRWMEVNPCKGIERPKHNLPRERRVSKDEIKKLRYTLDYKTDTVPKNLRQLTANSWLISLETAMRLGEVNSISDDSFFSESSYVQLVKTKNGTNRKAVCNERAVELIKLRLQSSVISKSHNISKCFENAVSRASVDDMTYHDSRHEGITRLAQKLDILDLARTVGIKNLKQLMIYYNATPEEIAAKLD